MPFAWAELAVSAYGASQSGKSSGGGGGGDPVAAADPFASQRGQYQTQLASFMQPGGFSPSDPSYQWRMQQGLEGVSRTAAASGMLHSGNRLAALEQYGQGLASSEYDQQYQRLAQLSGATIGSPGTAGSLQANQNAASSAAWQQLAGKAVGTVQNWYNNSGSSGGGNYGGGNTDIPADASGVGFF